MANIVVDDPNNYLGVASPYDLSFLRALGLLAQATAPSPRSRYRPASRWTIAKYLTVCDPRRRGGSVSPFIVNPGIRDLDPHQKGVLSDDIGMAIALGLIDESHGIKGLADAYALVSSGALVLKTAGRHRRMPDFVLELRKPIANSKFVLLECKGSVVPGNFANQLDSACKRQLENVSTLYGIHARTIPKIAAASELFLGGQLTIHLDDPPELLEKPLSDQLQANLLALEYSLFGDLRSANDVWKAYDLPSFTASSDDSRLPDRSIDTFTDEAITTLAGKEKFGIDASGRFEAHASSRDGHALTRVSLEMSLAAKAARKTRDWTTALDHRSVGIDTPNALPKLTEGDNGIERRIEETAHTSTGLTVNASMHIWYEH